MNAAEVRIKVEGLEPGMYVVKLDRPWLETPHLMQGFVVESPDDAERVAKYSKYVYIDTERGPQPDPHFVLQDEHLGSVKPISESLNGFHSAEYNKKVALQEEISTARTVHLDMERVIADTMKNLQEEKSLKLEVMQGGINAMTDSIVRNPEALVWLSQLKRKDSYTYNHSIGTSVWAATFARYLGLPRNSIDTLAMGGLLLDVGKAALPDSVLQASTRLTPEQMKTVESHVAHSLNMVKDAPGVDERILAMVGTHHERFDGSGYPQGLSGDEIPIFGRIAAVVDTYDALTSQRPYAKAMSPHGAVGVLYEWRGIDFQPELVERFIQTIGIYPTGTLVELTTGEVGVIISINDHHRLRPSIMLLLDREKKRLKEFQEIDLMQDPVDERGKPVDIRRGLPPGSFDIDTHELFL